SVRAARYSALWALFFISLLYTMAPVLGAMSKLNVIKSLDGVAVEDAPAWYHTWADVGLITHNNVNGDGVISLQDGFANATNGLDLAINNDIVVLAAPEIAGLPAPIIGLVAAGGLAAALSTASGLLLVISSSVANDVYYKKINPQASEARQLGVGRIAMVFAILVAGYLGINPPGFVAEVVALAFGLAAASFFPILFLGIFWKKATAMGAAAGMAVGLSVTFLYQVWTLPAFLGNDPIMGIPATGIGTIGMILNLLTIIIVSQFTPKPTPLMQQVIEDVRYPGRSELVVAHAEGELSEEELYGEERPEAH
ncbi:MAG: VC_2705 family sodium/solute symporter, partial [Actinomycetia bacterium]|nr:VC_2705 family sodium/solute symporter [Actinomycetes bacterium]